MRTLWPMAATGAPSSPIHKGFARHRSIPSCRRSTCSAAASGPGPRARSRAPPPRARSRMCSIPESGSSARNRTPAPIPGFARHVEHVGGAVAQIHVGVTGLEKQRSIARRHAAERVTRRIGLEIRLGLDDPARRPSPARRVETCRAGNERARPCRAERRAVERWRRNAANCSLSLKSRRSRCNGSLRAPADPDYCDATPSFKSIRLRFPCSL